MRIVHTHFHARRTGVTAHVEAMLRSQQRFGRTALWSDGVSLMADDKTSAREILQQAQTESVVIHAHRNGELLRALALRRLRKNIRVVATRHSDGVPSSFSSLLLMRADARVVLSPHYQQLVKPSAQVVAHGIDCVRFRAPTSRAEAFAALQLQGQRAVGVVGRIRFSKGQSEFIEAFRQVEALRPDWAGLLVGDVKRSSRRWLATQLQGSRIEWRPSRTETNSVYQGLHLLVQPSHAESFGLVALEAMACGVCVVASDLPTHRSFIEHGHTGFLYPVGDVKALTALLLHLTEDDHTREAVGARAAETVAARFDVAFEADALHALYQRLY
jgi:mannosyltransferase